MWSEPFSLKIIFYPHKPLYFSDLTQVTVKESKAKGFVVC